RDKEDYRINLVYGNILLEKNKIEEALNCYNNGIKRISQYDDRSISGELYYYKGLAYLFQNDKSKAEEMFYKASWSLDTKSNALLKLAQLNKSNELLQESLKLNALNIKALHLQVSLNKNELKPYLIKYPLDLYFNIQAYNLKMISEEEVLKIFNNKTNNYLDTVQELLENSEVELAINCLNLALKENKYPLFYYYLAYIYSQNNVFETKKYLELAEKASPYLCFPNDLSSALVLSHLDSKYNLRMGKYYLGCFYYDKKEYAEALFLWQKITDIPFPTLYRNLGIVTYNYENNNQKAQEYYEKAFNLDIDDMTVLLEYDQLKKLSKVPLKERLDYLNKYQIFTSDALLIEYLSLLNDNQEYQKVLEILSKHKFHIWEGGEGKVAYEYEKALINLALKEKKTEYLLKALDYPLNLGEGKIIFNKQNHIYYLLGYLLEIKGHKEESLKYYKMATHGEYKITNGLFYNDINLEIIFFQYLAFKKLNKVKERKEFKIKLENYLQKNEGKTLKMDYFAISYPNISVFKEDLKAENIVYCSFIKILLLLLKGKTQIALRDFNLFEKANPYFKTYLKYSVDLVNIFG
ncbi:MAG: hypothetical protein LBM99_01020, partial [Bacillales bacterium]|nr:hypothetical protein [Bacillales bacterium]